MIKLGLLGFWILLSFFSHAPAQGQFEFENNFIHTISFVTGNEEGIEKNLDDNFQWMQNQGHTHLRFFGIYPDGYHTFPSFTLDTNGFPSDSTTEQVLGILVNKAKPYGITINFDGWEVIAESNRDTTELGVGYITEEELSTVVLNASPVDNPAIVKTRRAPIRRLLHVKLLFLPSMIPKLILTCSGRALRGWCVITPGETRRKMLLVIGLPFIRFR